MLNDERWKKFSRFEQMGHIGNEIARASRWQQKQDVATRNQCLERAFELIDQSLSDAKWQGRRRELCRLRELLGDQYSDARQYDASLEDLEKYCMDFALVARQDC